MDRARGDSSRQSAPWSYAELVDIGADDHTFTHVTRGFIIGTDGILHVELAGGDEVEFPAGTWAVGVEHPGRLVKVFDDSTAENIWGVW